VPPTGGPRRPGRGLLVLLAAEHELTLNQRRYENLKCTHIYGIIATKVYFGSQETVQRIGPQKWTNTTYQNLKISSVKCRCITGLRVPKCFIIYFVDRASGHKFLLVTNLMHFFIYLFIHFTSLRVSSIKCSSSGDRIVLIHYLV